MAKRSLAFFMLAFVCLNAFGLVCLAYCSGSERLEAAAADTFASDHCGRPAKGRDDELPAGDRLHLTDECCMLPTTLVGGALERSAAFEPERHPEATAEAGAFGPQFFPLSAVEARTSWPTAVNRPPPLLSVPLSGANIFILRI